MASEPTTAEHSAQATPRGIVELLDLSKKQRNLLLLRPLFQLELNKNAYADSGKGRDLLEGVDTHYLVLSALDYLMEGTTAGFGRRIDEVLAHLIDIVGQMKPSLAQANRERVAAVVLDALDKGNQPTREFCFEYFDAQHQEIREVRFRLVGYEPDLENVYWYKPTPEGYLVYLGMLDLSPADSQEIMEKMLQLLMDRGRFNEALEIAKRARTHSIEYRQRIRDRLLQSYRAPGTVNWSGEMTPYLNEARNHVQRRQSEDQRMVESVKGGLVSAEDLKARESMVALRDVLENSSSLRTRLLSDITVAPEKFLRAQEAVFRARRPSGLPDLDTQLLPKLIGLPVSVLEDFASTEIGVLYPCHWPRLYSLNSVFASLLERRTEDAPPEVDDGELVLFTPLPDQFTSETIDAVNAWLGELLKLQESLTLEDILLAAQAQQMDETFQRCVFFILLRAYAPSESVFEHLKITDGGRFKLDLVQGSNLLFTKTDKPDDH